MSTMRGVDAVLTIESDGAALLSVVDPAPQPKKRLDSLDAIKALVACEGNSGMAARMLGTDEPTLLAAIIVDGTSHEILSRYVRAYTTMQAFGMIGKLTAALTDSIDDGHISAKDMAKLMTGMMEHLGKLTDVRNTSLNPAGSDAGGTATAILDMLPEHIKQAVHEVIQASD